MIFRKTTDPHCSSCGGKGEVISTERCGLDDWVTSVDCHCVEYYHDDEMKEFLTSILSSDRGDEVR
jgi:hypothetical protein